MSTTLQLAELQVRKLICRFEAEALSLEDFFVAIESVKAAMSVGDIADVAHQAAKTFSQELGDALEEEQKANEYHYWAGLVLVLKSQNHRDEEVVVPFEQWDKEAKLKTSDQVMVMRVGSSYTDRFSMEEFYVRASRFYASVGNLTKSPFQHEALVGSSGLGGWVQCHLEEGSPDSLLVKIGLKNGQMMTVATSLVRRRFRFGKSDSANS